MHVNSAPWLASVMLRRGLFHLYLWSDWLEKHYKALIVVCFCIFAIFKHCTCFAFFNIWHNKHTIHTWPMKQFCSKSILFPINFYSYFSSLWISFIFIFVLYIYLFLYFWSFQHIVLAIIASTTWFIEILFVFFCSFRKYNANCRYPLINWYTCFWTPYFYYDIWAMYKLYVANVDNIKDKPSVMSRVKGLIKSQPLMLAHHVFLPWLYVPAILVSCFVLRMRLGKAVVEEGMILYPSHKTWNLCRL